MCSGRGTPPGPSLRRATRAWWRPRTTPYEARTQSPEEVREEHQALRGQTRLLPGKRPASLVEVRPQGKMVQHSGVGFELVQALNVHVLQMVEQPVEEVSFFRNSLPLVAEHVIEVPKLALPDGFLLSSFPLEPQLAEQLLEVPTEPAYVEQIVDNPVPRGRGARGVLPGLQLFSEQIVDIPVPHTRRRRPHGGLQGPPKTANYETDS